MIRVRFLRSAQLESEGRHRGPRFEEGQVVDLPADQAERWRRRGVAELAPQAPLSSALMPAADKEPLSDSLEGGASTETASTEGEDPTDDDASDDGASDDGASEDETSPTDDED